MKIYLNVCCLSRPFDDRSQARIRIECEAILTILERCAQRIHRWCSSAAIEEEVDANPDWEMRRLIRVMLAQAHERLLLDQEAERLATVYHQQGVGVFDAIHLALAERHGCDILFTVDTQFLRAAGRVTPPLRTAVFNPASWILETT